MKRFIAFFAGISGLVAALAVTAPATAQDGLTVDQRIQLGNSWTYLKEEAEYHGFDLAAKLYPDCGKVGDKPAYEMSYCVSENLFHAKVAIYAGMKDFFLATNRMEKERQDVAVAEGRIAGARAHYRRIKSVYAGVEELPVIPVPEGLEQ